MYWSSGYWTTGYWTLGYWTGGDFPAYDGGVIVLTLKRNVAGQKLPIYAWNAAAGAPKTGDAANITGKISLNGAAPVATNDVNPTELDATDMKGVYVFDLSQAETDADMILVSAVSSSTNVSIKPVFANTIMSAYAWVRRT